jgi:SnoaL-like polyketide cyclase
MARMKNISELNKLRVRLFIEAVLNEGRLELIDELIAADFVGHLPCAEPDVTGPAGVRQFVSSRRRAHPGLYVKVEDQIAEDDRCRRGCEPPVVPDHGTHQIKEATMTRRARLWITAMLSIALAVLLGIVAYGHSVLVRQAGVRASNWLSSRVLARGPLISSQETLWPWAVTPTSSGVAMWHPHSGGWMTQPDRPGILSRPVTAKG